MIVSFAHPAVLALLVVPAWLLWWVWNRAGSRVALPFDHGRHASARLWSGLLGLAESLPALILAIVLLILAGPQQLGQPKSKRVLTNIEFCVDISGSMNAPFGDGTRYDGSMKAIDQFLSFRKGDAFGLTFFGNNVLHWAPLTSDVSAIRCAPPFMKPSQVPPWFGGTMVGKALMACKDVLARREEGDRMIVLVTDGMSFDLVGGNDQRFAEELRKERIAVYAIHVADSPVPNEIVNIAGLTGGAVFDAGDPAGLEAVFRSIDGMRQTRLEKLAAETMDDFGPTCMAGLSLLGLAGLASLGLRYTPW